MGNSSKHTLCSLTLLRFFFGYNLTEVKTIWEKAVFLISFAFMISPACFYSQSFHISGIISTESAAVSNAEIIFSDDNDTTKQYSAITGISGAYYLDIITSVKEDPIIPESVELGQNYPNPFLSSTTIPYKLNTQFDVYVTIYDILGREVKKIIAGLQTAGQHRILWDGRNDKGNQVARGIYLYRIQAGKESFSKKMIYGTGESNIFIMPTEIILSHNIKKETSTSVQVGTFTVKIENTNSTSPKISPAEFKNINLHKDTTINFSVKENIMEYSLCYQREDSITYKGEYPYRVWSVHLSNTTGTNKKIIISKPLGSESRGWSPDGRYIAINHEDSLGIGHAYLYDTANDSLVTDLVPSPSGTMHSGISMCTPDGRIIYRERDILEPVPGRLYIIDANGTNKQKLVYEPIYFHLDNYNFIFYDVMAPNRLVVFHSNLDGTVLDTLVDLTEFVSTPNGGVSIYDFNPNTNDLLLSFNDPSTDLPNIIAIYNIPGKYLDTIMVSDSGCKCYMPKFSNDFKKIAVKDRDLINLTSRISILDIENKSKTVAVDLPHRNESGKIQGFEFSPIAFSPDNKFLAYTVMITQNKPGEYVWWKTYLYVVDLETKQSNLIDSGILPQWNPLKSH